MLKYLFSACILSLISFASCIGKVEEEPDNASAIKGTYKITKYVTPVSSYNNPSSGNNVIVTKFDKNTVKGQIVYSDGSKPVDANSLAITKSGSNYNLSKKYSTASANGSVSGNTLKLNINYDDGSYVQITAVK